MEKEETCHCAICPLCDLRFPATSLVEANFGLYEHLQLGHRGVQKDALWTAYTGAKRTTAAGEAVFPNVLKDRIPSPKDPVEFHSFHNPDGDNERMKELAKAKLSKGYFSSLCCECGDGLRGETSEELDNNVRLHLAKSHTEIATNQDFTNLVRYIMNGRRFIRAGTAATPEPPEPNVSTKPASTYVFTCPICDEIMLKPTYEDLVKSVEAHALRRHSGFLESARVSQEFRSYRPDELRTTLSGYVVASNPEVPEAPKEAYVVTDDPENPVVPLDTTLPKNQWDPVKPPIGIQPEHLWREHRMYELIACINRWHESGFYVEPEWLAELRSILVDSHFLSVLKEATQPC